MRLYVLPLGLLAACSSFATRATTSTPHLTTSAPATATSSALPIIPASATTATSATSSTTVTPSMASFPNQELAAQKLYRAWVAGDVAGAAGLGPSADIANLFSKFKPQPNAEDRHCDNGEFGTSSCFFANGQGGVNVTVIHNVDGSWTITKIDAY